MGEELEKDLVELSEEDTIVPELTVVKSENPYVLCTIEGTFMMIEEDNGNGRWYQKQTIVQKILEDDYVRRMMSFKALLGEAHHPLDRTSIWSDEACLCTRELWIDSTGKRLMGRGDILDTPKGRIIYTLIMYGTKIGISARANGKGVKQGGHLVIKPEHYFFKTFDVVLNPGFREARPAVFEKDGRTPLKVYEEHEDIENRMFEEFKDMVSNNSCDRKMLKDYIEYCESDKLKELIPLMEDESTEPSEDDTSASSQVCNEEVGKLQEKIKEYEALERRVKTLSSNYETEISDLRTVNEELESKLQELTHKFSNSEECDAVEVIEELLEEIEQKNKELVEVRESLQTLQSRNRLLRQSYADIEGLNHQLTEEMSLLEEVVATTQMTGEELVEEEKPQKLFKKQVNLFETVDAVMNEEAESSRSVSDNQQASRINFIKSLGGKNYV